jgi:hypothetical protein
MHQEEDELQIWVGWMEVGLSFLGVKIPKEATKDTTQSYSILVLPLLVEVA